MHFFPKKIQVETETETNKDRENSTTNIYNLESIKVSIENTKESSLGTPLIPYEHNASPLSLDYQ